jgi:hypothetical protein
MVDIVNSTNDLFESLFDSNSTTLADVTILAHTCIQNPNTLFYYHARSKPRELLTYRIQGKLERARRASSWDNALSETSKIVKQVHDYIKGNT